jgi:hypothetical protein
MIVFFILRYYIMCLFHIYVLCVIVCYILLNLTAINVVELIDYY